MKLDPIAIRSKSFSKRAIGGINSQEVSIYLEQLSDQWDLLNERNRELEVRLEKCNSQVQRLRELENALLKELDDIRRKRDTEIADAKREAETIVKAAETKAERIINSAKLKAHQAINEAELICKNKISAMQQQLRSMLQHYRFVDNEAKLIVNDLHDHLSSAQFKTEKLYKQYQQRKQQVTPKQPANRTGPVGRNAESKAAQKQQPTPKQPTQRPSNSNPEPNDPQQPPRTLHEKLLRQKRDGKS